MTTLSPESTVSHYKIKSLIARGGMGEVYKAVDLQLGRVVALKTILPARATDPNIYHRFLREARAASILAHPSICTIYEIGEAGDLTFIAMQYLEGKTIENLIAQGTIRVESALGYALDVAEALEEAHRHGVVHRDIKPSNVIVNERNTAVVLDFGLAKQVTFAGGMNDELPTQLQLTSSATLVGTGPYMAPEQILGEPLDGRSDIFSFGVALYEMLAGTRPFDGVTTVDVLHSILHDEPKPLSRLRPEVDPELAAIIGKMLAKKPDARHQTAREFSDELLSYIHAKGYAVRGSSGSRRDDNASSLRRTATQLQGSASTKTTEVDSRWRLLVALLFVIALVASVWWFWERPDGGTDQNQPSSLRYVQLVNWKSEPGELHSDAVFSRDGRMIAFSSRRGKFRDIWIKQTKMGDPNQVTKGEWNSWNPIWSPDSQQIAFLSKRGNQSGIWRMPALGGAPVLVGGSTAGNVRLKYWSRDGKNIYYELTSNLFSLDLATGKATQITNDSQPADQTSYSISPAEDRIAFVGLKNGQKDLWVRPLRGGPPIQVTNDSFEDRSPIWHPDGQRMIYSSIRDGVYQICVAFVDGRPPIQLTSGENDKFLLDVSFDGSSILHAATNEESDIWSITVNAEEAEVTSEPGAELWPFVFPDGNTIAYQSVNNPAQTRKLRDSVILTRPTATEGQKLQLAVGGVNPMSSPDGTTVAFVRWSDNMWNVWTVRATGGDERQLTKRGVFLGSTVLPYNRVGTGFYSWSPDGSKITYLSQAGNEAGLCSISTDGSQDTTITSNLQQSLYGPMWSSDGNRIAFVAAGNQPGDRSWSISIADLNSRKQHAVFEHSSAMSLLGWLGETDELLVATSESQGITETNPIDISLVSVPKIGTAKPVATLNSAYLYNMQLSPNGKSVAFASRQDGKDNIWLIPARGGEARKLTSNTDPRLYFSSMVFSPDGQKIYFGKQSSSTLISMIENFK